MIVSQLPPSSSLSAPAVPSIPTPVVQEPQAPESISTTTVQASLVQASSTSGLPTNAEEVLDTSITSSSSLSVAISSNTPSTPMQQQSAETLLSAESYWQSYPVDNRFLRGETVSGYVRDDIDKWTSMGAILRLDHLVDIQDVNAILIRHLHVCEMIKKVGNYLRRLDEDIVTFEKEIKCDRETRQLNLYLTPSIAGILRTDLSQRERLLRQATQLHDEASEVLSKFELENELIKRALSKGEGSPRSHPTNSARAEEKMESAKAVSTPTSRTNRSGCSRSGSTDKKAELSDVASSGESSLRSRANSGDTITERGIGTLTHDDFHTPRGIHKTERMKEVFDKIHEESPIWDSYERITKHSFELGITEDRAGDTVAIGSVAKEDDSRNDTDRPEFIQRPLLPGSTDEYPGYRSDDSSVRARLPGKSREYSEATQSRLTNCQIQERHCNQRDLELLRLYVTHLGDSLLAGRGVADQFD